MTAAEEPRAPKLAWVEEGQAFLGAGAQRRVQVPWEGGCSCFLCCPLSRGGAWRTETAHNLVLRVCAQPAREGS